MAVTSMLLGSGLTEAFGGRVNENPNAPADPELQAQYNQAAVQVGKGCRARMLSPAGGGCGLNPVGFLLSMQER